MLRYLEEMQPSEVENIRKTIQDLLRQTCILQTKCSAETLLQRDNPRYAVCNRHHEFISDYLSVMGCELMHDPQEKIFFIAGEGMPTEHINILNTKIMLLIKIIYHDKIMGSGLNATVTNLAEIREYGSDTNLITRKLTQKEWQDALSLLKTHQIIEFPGAVRNLYDNTPIYIYSTINLFLKTTDINEMVKSFQRQGEEEESVNETIKKDN